MTAKRMWIAGLGLLGVAVFAVTAGVWSLLPAEAADNDVEVVVDCDPSTLAVDASCVLGGAVTSRSVNVQGRTTGTAPAFIVGTFNFTLVATGSNSTTGPFFPPPGVAGLDSNPDFTADTTAPDDWSCGPPNADNDLDNDGNPNTTQSFISCFNGTGTGPPVAANSDFPLGAVLFNVIADGTVVLTLADVGIADDTFTEVMSCNPVVTFEGDCFGSEMSRGAVVPPTATNTPVPPTPTATNTPVAATPTATNTPAGAPTATETPTATNTPAGAPTATDTPLPTNTPAGVPTATDTPLPTNTPAGVPTDTPTATSTPGGPTPTATNTSVSTPTNTPGAGVTATNTPPPAATVTASSPAKTHTPTPSNTPAPGTTPGSATATPSVPFATPTLPGGGSGAGVIGPPNTGTGPGDVERRDWPRIALLSGLGLVVAGWVTRRTSARRRT